MCRVAHDVVAPTCFRDELVAPTRLNEISAVDFMHDALYGRAPVPHARRARRRQPPRLGDRSWHVFHFGPKVPAGLENNWTIPGKGAI